MTHIQVQKSKTKHTKKWGQLCHLSTLSDTVSVTVVTLVELYNSLPDTLSLSDTVSATVVILVELYHSLSKTLAHCQHPVMIHRKCTTHCLTLFHCLILYLLQWWYLWNCTTHCLTLYHCLILYQPLWWCARTVRLTVSCVREAHFRQKVVEGTWQEL